MYFRPAEWRKQKTFWLGWPFNEDLWGDDLVAAQQEFISLVHALKREQVVVVVPNAHEQNKVLEVLSLSNKLAIAIFAFGDIWLRDTFPIFVRDEFGSIAAVLPQFNGWGKKYQFADDMDLSTRIVEHLGVPSVRSSVIFEGGAIESDGNGCILTTEQCLLNTNRNPTGTKASIEKEFAQCFGARKVIWIKEGLKNDHTDGHIDTIARFIEPHTIAIMVPKTKDDPNYDVLKKIKAQLSKETDADGHPFSLVELPSPGSIVNREGSVMPASYLNFIIGDETMVVPLYDSVYDDEACAKLKAAVNLDVIGVKAKAILSGGGAFHCISQEYYR